MVPLSQGAVIGSESDAGVLLTFFRTPLSNSSISFKDARPGVSCFSLLPYNTPRIIIIMHKVRAKVEEWGVFELERGDCVWVRVKGDARPNLVSS